MARPTDRNPTEGKSEGPKKKKGSRAADDLELMGLILNENPRLKARVLNFLETALNKPSSE